MSLSSLQLDAFAEVAKLKSFSAAAKKLHVTQSALSQRILNLEDELGSSLFVRESSGLRLTELGQKLQRYCQSRAMLENDFMGSLAAGEGEGLRGVVCIAGFATINRSVLLPLVGDFLKEHPLVNISLRTAELRDLPRMLFSGATDYILTNQPINKQEVEDHLVGYEENVLIQSTAKHSLRDVYLDYDEEDETTQDFFRAQSKRPPILKRNYFGDIYSLIDGVRMGMGRAVVPQHLIAESKGIEVVKGYSPKKVPVYLSYYRQAFFTDLQKAVIDLLQTNIPKALKG
jgi:DNA-binding transcriptional LysR family regulator